MKICFLAKTKAVHTARWINYFAERGYEVTLITDRSSKVNEMINERVKIRKIWFPPHSIAKYGALLEISRIIKEVNPDIIHAHYISHFGILAAMYQKLSGFSPIVLTAWGSDILIDPKGLKRFQVKKALNQANLITCDATHMKEFMQKEFGVNGDKIEIINFGTDTVKYCPGSRNNAIREKLDLKDKPIIISTRSLNPIYDIGTLIRAVPIIKAEIPNIHIVIGGQGSEKEHLQELSKALKIEESVHFVGFIQQEELPSYLTASDIYVSTSLSDAGLAASTAEAMACGLPAVITDFGDNGNWINNGNGGFLFPLKDHNELANCILQLLKNKELRREYGKRNRNIIMEHNNYYIEMKKVEDLYKKAQGDRK